MMEEGILCSSDGTASLGAAADTGAVNVSKVPQHDRLSLAQEEAEMQDRTESTGMCLLMPDKAVGCMATYAGHTGTDQSPVGKVSRHGVTSL